MNIRTTVIFFSFLFYICLNISEPSFGSHLKVLSNVNRGNLTYTPVSKVNLAADVQRQPDFQKIRPVQNKNDKIYISILMIVIVSGIIFFRIIDLKHKQLIELKQKEIREQTINELKIDHQLLASRAVLMGEEKERGRISRDLHDGLGGMLSGVKLGLSGFRENNAFPAEMNEKLDLALNQLNASISELRSIAQNLMPEALTNFGLKDALNDYCMHLGDHKGVEISFLSYGESVRFDQSIENALFRIAQEAITNALNHSNATEIIVQMIQDQSWVNLTIQDNGQGFDPEEVRDKQSGGLINMRARAEIFDGRFHINSKPGEGTEIIVDLIYNENT